MNDTAAFYKETFATELVRAPTPALCEVSVVMVVFHTGPALNESLARALNDPDVDELVIVDNGSGAEEIAAADNAESLDQRVTVIRGQGNVGFARGANMGAKAAHGRVLVILNPDAFLENGCVRRLVAALDNERCPCLVGARIVNPDGSEQRGARRGEVTPVTSLLSLTGLTDKVGALSRYEIHHESDPKPCGPMPVPTISGAGFAMRRRDFFSLDGFDESYFLHVEDVDLCWRVRRAGGRVLFEPMAKIVHLGSTSLQSPVTVEYWKGVGLARFFRKRADTLRRKLTAILLTPLIVMVSVARPILRGQAFKRRGGLRF